MSVAAMIIEPKDRDFYVPVASEAFFCKCWIPASIELKLQYIPLFQSGVDIQKEDLPLLFQELSQLMKWSKQNLSKEDGLHLCSRVELLKTKLTEAFSEEGVIVFIG
ncbi:hypothetical protein [Paenibacillus sanfengchensis]|uniref:hypothetical protein n=1 Tax=Paenibacillus sanfengchensis TaxID=3119819 RepID=UPI002FE1B959